MLSWGLIFIAGLALRRARFHREGDCGLLLAFGAILRNAAYRPGSGAPLYSPTPS